jgi:hypothetical protein
VAFVQQEADVNEIQLEIGLKKPLSDEMDGETPERELHRRTRRKIEGESRRNGVEERLWCRTRRRRPPGAEIRET